MSSYVEVKGKAIKVESCLQSLTMEEWAEHELTIREEEKSSSYETALEQILDDPGFYDLERINGELYYQEVETEYNPLHRYCNIHRSSDGTIEFEAFYYDGGCHWSELVEEEVSKLDNQIKDTNYV